MATVSAIDLKKAQGPDAPSTVESVNLAEQNIPFPVLRLLPQETAAQYRVIIFKRIDTDRKATEIWLAAERPSSPEVKSLVEFLEHRNHVAIRLFQAESEGIDAQLSRYLEQKDASPDDDAPERTKVERQGVTSERALEDVIHDGSIPRIVDAVIDYALEQKASDIHIEPNKDNMLFRFRIDGNLANVTTVPRYFRNALISRIKILAQMKIDEQRIPQDGRFGVTFRGHNIDIRVSTLPTVYGEKVELRLLDKDANIYTLEQLGITGHSFDAVLKAVNKPYGIVLSTGPTGSGKTTTLYAVLNRLLRPDVNIVTLEDPVEYEIPGINQSQIKPDIGYTFAEGLRAVLRQDPNVIMVGEIRDLETASMATHAALTGHLVLSTLHTNDAASALPRLINMGVEPFLITSSINAIVAQRLVRKLCPSCRTQTQLPDSLTAEIRDELGRLKGFPLNDETRLQFYDAKGCEECQGGYAGRIGIFEVLVMSDTLEEMTIKRQPADAIAATAIDEGMITMRQDGILKALKGITSIDEVWGATKED